MDQDGTRTRTALLVENSETVLEVVTLFLTTKGYKVLKSRSGKEALRIIEEHSERLDLVVTSDMLGYVSAVEVALRCLERDRCPVLLMCGISMEFGNKPDLEMARSFPFGRYSILQKPFTPSSFWSCVDELIKRSADPYCGRSRTRPAKEAP